MNRFLLNLPSLAHSSGCLLFLTGQTASGASGHIVNPGDIMAQYEQVLHNLQTVVEAVGETMQDMAQMTTFVGKRRWAAKSDQIAVRRAIWSELDFVHFGGKNQA